MAADVLVSATTILTQNCPHGIIITETKKLSFWRNFHHWLHRKLSKWQLPVQPVMKISPKWQHPCFSDYTQIILHTKHIALRALNKPFSLDVGRLTTRWFLYYWRFIVLTTITPYGHHCCGSLHECLPHKQVDRSKWERRVYSQLGPLFRTVCLKGNEMRRVVSLYPYTCIIPQAMERRFIWNFEKGEIQLNLSITTT